MIEVIEIPVFLSDLEYASDLFQNCNLVDAELNAMKYYIYSLNENKEIIYYFFEINETIEDPSILDRLIPKTPFCFIFLMGQTFIVNNFCESYKERYNTPLFCLKPKVKSDFDTTYITNNLLKNEHNQLIEFIPENASGLRDVMISSFDLLLKNQR